MKIQDMEATHEGWEPTLREVGEFLKGLPLCSFATLSSNGRPQIARVAFSVHEGLGLIVGTSATSRKAKNVNGDAHVAVEATDEDQRYTVQYEGSARQISEQEFAAFEDEHYRQRPESAPFRDEPGQCHILITPTWVRFSDCNPQPWVLSEFTFSAKDAQI